MMVQIIWSASKTKTIACTVIQGRRTRIGANNAPATSDVAPNTNANPSCPPVGGLPSAKLAMQGKAKIMKNSVAP